MTKFKRGKIVKFKSFETLNRRYPDYIQQHEKFIKRMQGHIFTITDVNDHFDNTYDYLSLNPIPTPIREDYIDEEDYMPDEEDDGVVWSTDLFELVDDILTKDDFKI